MLRGTIVKSLKASRKDSKGMLINLIVLKHILIHSHYVCMYMFKIFIKLNSQIFLSKLRLHHLFMYLLINAILFMVKMIFLTLKN